MKSEEVKRFKWEIVIAAIVAALGLAYFLSHRGEGIKTEIATKAVMTIDTIRAVTDTVAFDIDTLKDMASQQDIQSRRNAVQMKEVIDYIRKSDREAAKEIERAADTVKVKP
jgi:hypothetical protein